MLDHAMGYPLKIEEKAADPLAGGIINYGYQCGMLWGSALAAGAQSYRLYGPGAKAETAAVLTAQKIVPSFQSCNRHKEINCLEITDINMKNKIQIGKVLKFIVSGGAANCFIMVGKCSKAALRELNTALPDTGNDIPSRPVSCAAMVAQKMGAAGIHQVMAAGLAGGIGFSGGGCGALGAAIWISAINSNKQGADRKTINAKSGEIINKFLKASDFKFECLEIVGRKFENIKDHADYLQAGGCAKIIESLVTE